MLAEPFAEPQGSVEHSLNITSIDIKKRQWIGYILTTLKYLQNGTRLEHLKHTCRRSV